MGKLKTKIQIRKENQEKQELELERALQKAKAKRTDPRKRKDNACLAAYLSIPCNEERTIRPVDHFVAKSYNLGRQIQGLIDHAFVQYATPLFLYRSILTDEGVKVVFGDSSANGQPQTAEVWEPYREWFFAAAQGGSVAKAMKSVLNKKEVHHFLQAPDTNSIERNVFWARCAAADMPAKLCQFLTDHLGSWLQQQRIGDRMNDLIRFYANEHRRMGEYELREITDFVRTVVQDHKFSFKGRTLGSMLKLTNEWHRTMHTGAVAVYQFWEPAYRLWTYEHKDVRVQGVELTSNRLLVGEGRKQRHCVFSYAGLCVAGVARIVSLRWLGKGKGIDPDPELNRLTLEIRTANRSVVQIRGRMNRMPTDDEMSIVRRWAMETGLTVAR